MKKAAFQGRDEISQLDAIYRICGTPNETLWPAISSLPWYHLIKPKQHYPSHFRKYFGKWFSHDALDLLERMLQLDPAKRVSANEALNDAYFQSLEPFPCQPDEYIVQITSVYFTFLIRLPRPDGDWHEYETKQRKRAAAGKESNSAKDKDRSKRPKP